MRKPDWVRPLSYQKVLLAIYILADDKGSLCSATCEEVGRQARVSTTTAWKQINQLHDDGVINIRGSGSYYPRLFVLLDYPGNQEHVDRMDAERVMNELQPKDA